MLDPANVPDVDLNEMLSRFILTQQYVNRQTKQLKPAAFVPHPYEELSVTRDREATDKEVWNVGRDIAEFQQKTLHGRGDVLAATYVQQKLKTIADPVERNPNHVNVTKWPSAADKAAQKLIAQEIAAVARFVSTPENGAS
ncbi:MAG: hypothetical protein WKF77_02685 [Planctomycetaceae bacterium]